jgi:hypothetical protein
LKIKELSFASCQRVRNNVKGKNLGEMRVLVAETVQTFPKWEGYPAPRVSVSVASKGFSFGASLLFAPLAGRCISVAAKGLGAWGRLKVKGPDRVGMFD